MVASTELDISADMHFCLATHNIVLPIFGTNGSVLLKVSVILPVSVDARRVVDKFQLLENIEKLKSNDVALMITYKATAAFDQKHYLKHTPPFFIHVLIASPDFVLLRIRYPVVAYVQFWSMSRMRFLIVISHPCRAELSSCIPSLALQRSPDTSPPSGARCQYFHFSYQLL